MQAMLKAPHPCEGEHDDERGSNAARHVDGGVSGTVRYRGAVRASTASGALAEGFRLSALRRATVQPVCEPARRTALAVSGLPSSNQSASGTIFASTKLPLTTWFLALYLLTQTKNNISALELMRHLGVGYSAAWRMKHKLMQAMADREAPPSGRARADR